jgi:hypothetical protein
MERNSLIKARINEFNEVITVKRGFIIKLQPDVSQRGFHQYNGAFIASGRTAGDYQK